MRSPRDIAADPTTSPADLDELARHQDVEVRRAVVGNPNTPMNALYEVAAEFPQAFLENPVVDLLLLEDPALPQSLPEDTICAVLALADVPPEFIDHGSRHHSSRVRRAIAAHPQTPPDILVELARHYFFFEEVTLNPNTPRTYQEFLVRHPWTSIRALFATRDGLERDFVNTLAADEEVTVRLAVAQRKDLPDDVHERLLEDDDAGVRRAARALRAAG